MQLTAVLCCDCCVNGCRVLSASSIKRHPWFHALITALCASAAGWVGAVGDWVFTEGSQSTANDQPPPQINTTYTASHTKCQNHYSYWRRMHVCVQANAPVSCVCRTLPSLLRTRNVNVKCKRSRSLELQWQLTMSDTKSIFRLLTDRQRMDWDGIWIRTRIDKKKKKTERNKKGYLLGIVHETLGTNLNCA